jgi:hypothetical protein
MGIFIGSYERKCFLISAGGCLERRFFVLVLVCVSVWSLASELLFRVDFVW